MEDNVFIGWCGKKETYYAEKLRECLKGSCLNLIIGGNSNPNVSSLSISDTIIKQMDTCSKAIFLFAKDINGRISPNILFEYGYMLNRLQINSNRILSIYIDMKPDDPALPSDIRNTWSLPVSSENEEEMFKKIKHAYESSHNSIIPFDKADFIIYSEFYKTEISRFKETMHYPLFHLAQYLMFYLQAAYFNEEIDEFRKTIESFKNEPAKPDYLNAVIKYCDISLRFYRYFYAIEADKLTLKIVNDFAQEYKHLLLEVEYLEDNELRTWLYAFIYEHIGFVYHFYLPHAKEDKDTKIHIIEKVLKIDEKASKYLEILLGGDHISNIDNNTFFSALFLTYVNRQKAVSYKILYELTKNEEYLETANEWFYKVFRLRESICNNFAKIKANQRAYSTIILDYFLSISEAFESFDDEDEIEYYKGKLIEYIKEKKRQGITYDNYFKEIVNKMDYHEDYTYTIAISGSSGVGKTTFVKRLGDFFKDYKTLEIIEDASKNPFVGSKEGSEGFYSQVLFYSQNLDKLSSIYKEHFDLVIFDRFIDEHYLISQFRHKNKEINDKELQVCERLKDAISMISPRIDLIIYLSCDVEEVKVRLKKRNEKWDEAFSSHSEDMQKFYDQWIDKVEREGLYQVERVDTTHGFSDSRFNDIVKRILKNIKKTM